jgi:hypothetical protein
MQVKIDILSDTIANIIVYGELFNPVKTNAFGLFNIVVGTGIWQNGSAPTFNSINWIKTPLFLRTSIYYQSNWKVMGSSKLESVPYSMVAGTIEGALPYVSVAGNTTTMDSALFVVRNNTGQIVFAVYNEGVRIYVDDGLAKGSTKGGFAIGGFGTSKGTSQPLFVVDPDSIRGYIGTNTGKGVTKGGFAIGGFNASKAPGEEYLRVTRDSTRVTINESSKGVKGGFAIGGFNSSKGTISPFTSLTPENYFIGDGSGSQITSGLYNSFYGYQSGISDTSGSSNVFIGYQTGYYNNGGSKNAFIGYLAGYSNTSGFNNIFMGDSAGFYNTTGKDNIFIGNLSGVNNSSGYNNVYLGFQSGFTNSTGSYNVGIGNQAGMYNTGIGNVFLGQSAGWHNSTGILNTFLGAAAGRDNTSGLFDTYIGSGAGLSATGNYNTFIGWNAGELTTGSGNVFIGFAAGASETGSNKLYIASQASATPLIWGDFGSFTLEFNGSVGIDTKTPTELLQVGLESSGSTARKAIKIGSGGFMEPGTYQTNSNGDKLILYNADSYDARIGVGSMADMWFKSAGSATNTGRFIWYIGSNATECMRIDGTGYVGIGTSSPGYQLEIRSTNANGFALTSGNDSYATSFAFGRSALEGNLAIAATAGQYATNASGGDVILRNMTSTRKLILTTGSGTSTMYLANGYLYMGNGSVAYCDGNTWHNSSDRNLKDNFEEADGESVLEKISELPILTWNYKSDDKSIRHMGPTSQDFYSAFGLGNDTISISTIDPAGISLAAIKQLDKQNKLMREEIESTKKENQQLRSELDELKSLVNNLVTNQMEQVNK